MSASPTEPQGQRWWDSFIVLFLKEQCSAVVRNMLSGLRLLHQHPLLLPPPSSSSFVPSSSSTTTSIISPVPESEVPGVFLSRAGHGGWNWHRDSAITGSILNPTLYKCYLLLYLSASWTQHNKSLVTSCPEFGQLEFGSRHLLENPRINQVSETSAMWESPLWLLSYLCATGTIYLFNNFL